jgi:hypothetical protein
MATTTARKPKKLTRADRENARKAAASANASLDLVRAGKIALIGVVVAVLALAVILVVPRGSSLGGPLQASRLEGAATLTAVPKTKGHPVTFGLSVPWNAGAAIVELAQRSYLAGLSPFVTTPCGSGSPGVLAPSPRPDRHAARKDARGTGGEEEGRVVGRRAAHRVDLDPRTFELVERGTSIHLDQLVAIL